jgi:di/tricarboxylate transporter
MVAVILPVIFGWVSIVVSAVVGATLMVLTGCLSIDEAYRYIEWPAVFLIAGMLPLGIAMETSGAASYLANGMISVVGAYGPLAVMAGMFLLTNLGSQVMPNAVVTVLMAPIAINIAGNLDVSPYTLMMVVAVAASASFMSPVGHPANVLVMGPGGYKFADYVKAGLPLTILLLVVGLLVIPIFWPP